MGSLSLSAKPETFAQGLVQPGVWCFEHHLTQGGGRIWGLGLRVEGLGFRVWGFGRPIFVVVLRISILLKHVRLIFSTALGVPLPELSGLLYTQGLRIRVHGPLD